jgi:hypothetical protein
MPPRSRYSGSANSFWRSGWVLCLLTLLATASYLAVPSMLLGDTYEPTLQGRGELSLNGEAKKGKIAVQGELEQKRKSTLLHAEAGLLVLVFLFFNSLLHVCSRSR